MINLQNIQEFQGVSEQEAEKKLQTEGYNDLPTSKKKSFFSAIWKIFQEPMLLFLIAASFIYFLLGDSKEAIMLGAFVLVVLGITFYQERKTDRALEALRDLSSPRALVIRDGKQKRIPGREVVRGDILILSEGDRVPADAVVLSSLHLTSDESLLTGESLPVKKTANLIDSPSSFVYSGTVIVQGQGIARVEKIGTETEIGKIGKSLRSIPTEKTKLEKETKKIVFIFATIAFLLCSLIVILYSLKHHDWLNGFLVGITMAMSMIPEEIPVILTVFIAIGAWRISRKQVLARHPAVLETLGSTTVLCVDKTGTLTENIMKVSQIFAQEEFHSISLVKNQENQNDELPETFHELIEFGILASQTDPFDPMDQAIRQLGDYFLKETEHLHDDWEMIQEYPLSSKLLALSHVWKSKERNDYIIAAKGSPEAIFDLCHLPQNELQSLTDKVQTLASEGLRVLAVSKARFDAIPLPDQQHDFDFEFIGLIGFADPVRPKVPAAIEECYLAGIRVIMMTGDYPATAQKIAAKIGLKNFGEVISGSELETMNDTELKKRIKTVNIFARMIPAQKLRLVEMLKAEGEIVGMTGDGVNDAPALKAAHIGIAMGKRGTDVAREASSIVLIDDDFSSIVEAIRSGRRIFDNLRKAMAYILAIHIPIAGIALAPVLLNWPLIFLPVQIAFLQLIIDPACSIAFEAEAEESDLMKHPPRDPAKSLFDKQIFKIGIFQGLFILAILLTVFFIASAQGRKETEIRTLTFSTLILSNLGLLLINRSWSRSLFAALRIPNRPLWAITISALSFLTLTISVPFLRELFQFSKITFLEMFLCGIAALTSVFWFELFKKWRKKNS